ncbi:hypothetical protein Kisp01_41900 [Kineosporia sp. NBRC 101677]|uniref:hypothetical protein n=1 Tax=Kineosporia sp. NBRC 101677 TaxID=3032197 RepID=UPI0024A571F4|nr:hypothetical protein [Kineosporia sp. NBRC 101677]GLY17175.1 hypothetical protein Kisp01_41900 [Kineosporia sp. NBRC 101677]
MQLTGLQQAPEVAADAMGARVTSHTVSADGMQTTYAVDLIDLATAKVQRIESSTGTLFGPAISATTISWFSPGDFADNKREIRLWVRSGDRITRYTEPLWPQSALALADQRVGPIVRPGDSDWCLRIFDGTSVRTVKLTGRNTGVAGVGNRFVAAVGGPLRTAGVYSIDRTAKRIATVGAEKALIASALLSAGQLWTADGSR